MSSIMNKVKDSMSSDNNETHTHPARSEAQHHIHSADARAPRHNEPHDSLLTGAQPHQDASYTSNNAYTTNTAATGPATTTAGPHSSNLMNKADPRVDSDLDGRNAQTHTTGVHGGNTFHTNPGHQQQHNVNSTAGLTSTGPASTTAGPHSSNMMNKVDPRVDSDLDGSKTVGKDQTFAGNTATHGTTNTGLNTTNPSTQHTHGANSNVATTGPAPTTAGPHSSNLMNKADPRVDSDLDGSKTVGQGQTFASNAAVQGMASAGFNPANPSSHQAAHAHGTHAPHGTHTTHGAHATHGTHATNTGTATTGPASSTAGPHSSNVMNKADPRVDSDLDGSKTVGKDQTFNTNTNTNTATNTTTGTHHNTAASHGHHQQAHNTHGAAQPAATSVDAKLRSAQTGPAPNTAGPHKSDLLNKLDPRVDSNLDGSKTLGKDQSLNH